MASTLLLMYDANDNLPYDERLARRVLNCASQSRRICWHLLAKASLTDSMHMHTLNECAHHIGQKLNTLSQRMAKVKTVRKLLLTFWSIFRQRIKCLLTSRLIIQMCPTVKCNFYVHPFLRQLNSKSRRKYKKNLCHKYITYYASDNTTYYYMYKLCLVYHK